MNYIDPLTDPDAQEFVWLDWETAAWVGFIWLSSIALIFLMFLADKMTSDILDILPKDEDPQLPR